MTKVVNKKNILEIILERKLNVFAHICRREGTRLVKNFLFCVSDERSIHKRTTKLRMIGVMSGRYRYSQAEETRPGPMKTDN